MQQVLNNDGISVIAQEEQLSLGFFLGFQIQYKHLVFSFPLDLMKTTVVVESLSYYKTNVLFQRILQDFKIKILGIVCATFFIQIPNMVLSGSHLYNA